MKATLKGSCSEIPSQGLCRERDKSQGETRGQGSFLPGSHKALLFQKAFPGYPSPETSPSLLPVPLQSCELDWTHSLHPGHSTGGHGCKGQSQVTPSPAYFSLPYPFPTLWMEELPSAAPAPLPWSSPSPLSLFLRTHDLIPNGAEHAADAHLTFLPSATFCYRLNPSQHAGPRRLQAH